MKHKVTELKAANGIRGLLINVPGAEVIRSQVWFNSGYRFSDPLKYEMPHITEHLILGGNEDYPDSILFKQEIEKNGAYFNGWTNNLFNVYEWECASFETTRILKLATSELSKPLIKAKDVVTEKSRVEEELDGYMSDHYRTLYDNAAYQFESRPKYKTRLKQLKNITPADMRGYYRRTHTAQNAMFFMAGDISAHKSAVMSGLESLGASLPQGQGLRAPASEKKVLKSAVTERRDIPQLHYQLEFSAGPTVPEEWAAASILITLLNSFLPSSLFGAVWKKGLAYGISSGFGYDHTSSNFYIINRVSPANAVPLFELILKQLRAVKQGKFTAKELAETKDMALGLSKRRYQTPGSVLGFYADDYMLFNRVLSIADWTELKMKVSAEDVAAIASKLTTAQPWFLSLVGPTNNKLADQLYMIANKLNQ